MSAKVIQEGWNRRLSYIRGGREILWPVAAPILVVMQLGEPLMDGSTVMLVVWALSAAVSAAVIRRRRYEGGLAIGLFICAALGGPAVLAFFVWASL